MAKLFLSKEFLSAYAKLPRPAQRNVLAAIAKFSEHTHAGLHLEKLTGAKDSNVRTIRFGDFYRGVVVALGSEEYVAMTVLPHDEANMFATSRIFTVNQVFGVLEVRDQTRLDDLAMQATAPTAVSIYASISDAEFRRLGIDRSLIPIVRAVTTDEQLDSLAKVLPDMQHLVLKGLAEGLTAQDVFETLAAQIISNVDTSDLHAAALRTPDKFAFVTGPHELTAILRHPFDAWRVFLDRAQRDMAYRPSYSGPALVTGSAGTGKTVTGLHRAVFLAQQLTDDAKVLLTTYTRTLAKNLNAQLVLLTDVRSQRDHIDVRGVDQLAFQVVEERRGRKPNVIEEGQLRELFDKAASNLPSYFDSAGALRAYNGVFLQREWEQVILAHRVTTLEAYLAIARRGRGGLKSERREAVWGAIADATSELARRRLSTHLQLADEAADLLTVTPSAVYRHAIVDEGQDLHPTQWRLLRALVPAGPNDLFLLADPYQRIYDHHVSLGSLGIDIRGRSRRLTVNYRTTHEILDWSVRVLGGQTMIGLDDNADSLVGYRSTTRGQAPALTKHKDWRSEVDALIERVGTWIENGVEPYAIGVAARTNQLVESTRKALAEFFEVADESKGITGVHVGTMHSLKGLEFQCLAVIGLDAGQIPNAYAVTASAEDPIAHAQDMQRERCLLFVAATRARDVLYLSHTGMPSSLLPESR